MHSQTNCTAHNNMLLQQVTGKGDKMFSAKFEMHPQGSVNALLNGSTQLQVIVQVDAQLPQHACRNGEYRDSNHKLKFIAQQFAAITRQI
jgi:hypothetical protein